jgi:hypothetical protein
MLLRVSEQLIRNKSTNLNNLFYFIATNSFFLVLSQILEKNVSILSVLQQKERLNYPAAKHCHVDIFIGGNLINS